MALRPLAIKPLKQFMKELERLDDEELDQFATVDVILDLAKVCLKGIKNPLGSREDLDEILDVESAYKIIDVCGGVKLNDPKLMEAAMRMAAQAAAEE